MVMESLKYNIHAEFVEEFDDAIVGIIEICEKSPIFLMKLI